MSRELIAFVEQMLADQRDANAKGYDREQALVEFRGIALDVATSTNRVDITPDQLWAWAETPEQHARLRSLVDRAFTNPTTPEEVLA